MAPLILLKSSYEIFKNIYDIINHELNNLIVYEDTKNFDEIDIDNIVSLISSSITLDLEVSFISYYKSIYLSTFKNYEQFIKHYIENTLLVYVLQNNKINIYKALLKEYFKNVIESTSGLINKNPNIFSNTKFYFNIYKTIKSSESKYLNIHFIGDLINNNFNILMILYVYSSSHIFLNHYINIILEKNHVGEITKIINNMVSLIDATIYNNQMETYNFFISKYYEISKQNKNNNNLITINDNKYKYQFKNALLKINDSVINKINVLSYYKVILSYFSKDELEKLCIDYADISIIIKKFKNKDILFGYFDLIGYEKYEFNESNYVNKIYILIYLSVTIDYKDGVCIYEELKNKDKNKYLINYINSKEHELISLLKMYKKTMYIDSILDYLLQNDIHFINKFLTFIIENKFENYEIYFNSIKKFITNPYIFQLLNDDSHIKLIIIMFSNFKEDNEHINTYIQNMKQNNYIFSNIEPNIDSNKSFINMLYEKNKDLLLYILKSYEQNEYTNLSKIIIKLSNTCIHNNDMDFFYILFENFFKAHNIDLYNGIVVHIKNNDFINYIRNNETTRNELQKYVKYKKDYLINIDITEHSLKDCKCKCNICDLFYLDSNHDYKNSDDYNPIFYYCNECNMNIHDECLFKIMKNHRGKIKKCIFCNSNRLKYIKLSTFEFKYIIYNKLLNNFDFTIQSLE